MKISQIPVFFDVGLKNTANCSGFYFSPHKNIVNNSNFAFFSPTAECFGVSANIAFGVLRGTARPCRLVSPVPGTRVPRTGSGNQGSGQGSGNPGFREPRVPGIQGSGNQGSGQGSRNPRFRKPDFQARFWEQWVLAIFWVPGRQGSGKVPGTLSFRQGSGNLTMVSSSQSLDCAKVLELPEHQFWDILQTQSLGNQDSGKVPATLGSDKVPRTTTDADPQFGCTSWIMPQFPDRDKVRVLARFRGSGNNPRVGYMPWVVPRFMLRTGSQKTNL